MPAAKSQAIAHHSIHHSDAELQRATVAGQRTTALASATVAATVRPATISPQLLSVRDEIRGFLNRCFDGQSGWLCLGWIAGDPALDDMREQWYSWPRQADQVAARAAVLAERGHNLYIGLSLHREPKRSYATALPSAWLWLDDTAIDGAELIETSDGNYQSWLKLDQAISAEERSHFQRAIRDESAGADTCSADAVHMTRLPGGYNCKQHGAWRVRTSREANRVFSVAELRERYPEAAQQSHQTTETGDWSNLPNGERLTHSARFRALRKANNQLDAVCKGERVSLAIKRTGEIDDSPSNQRAIFVAQLVRAHYLHDEIRALADHFRNTLLDGSHCRDFERDIDRLLSKYTPQDYKPEATRGGRQVEPPRGGRHRTLTAGELLDYLHQHAESGRRGLVVELSRGEIAEALGVSYGTVQRCERELQGHIRREASEDRQRSYVILSPATWDIRSKRIAERFDQTLPPENASSTDVRSKLGAPDEDALNGQVTSQCEERARSLDHEITHPPGVPSSLDTWAWADPAYGAQDLAALDEQPEQPEPAAPAQPADVRRELLTRVRRLASALGGAALIEDYSAMTAAELRAWEWRLLARLRAAPTQGGVSFPAPVAPSAVPVEWQAADHWLGTAEGQHWFTKASRPRAGPRPARQAQ